MVPVSFVSRTFRRLFVDQRGISMLESAFVLPVLALALAVVGEYGLNIGRKHNLQAALSAATQYAMNNPNDLNGIKAVIEAGLPAGHGATISTPTYACECNNGTTVSCGPPIGTCSSGTARKLILLTASQPPLVIGSMLVGMRPSIIRVSTAVSVPTS